MNESGRHSLMSHLLRKHVHFCEPHCPLTKKKQRVLPCSSGAQSIIYNLVGDNTDQKTSNSTS
ncbi:hypothetical protein J4K19_003602 [Vibrio vulnificus]|nr:hypothetical protein [Vibrio vulnificus]